MVNYHHWLNGRECEQTQEDSEGQRSLACCSAWHGVAKSQTGLSDLMATTKYIQMTNKHMKRCSTSWIIRKTTLKPQWDITLYPLGELLSRKERRKGGRNHSSSKESIAVPQKKSENYHVVQQFLKRDLNRHLYIHVHSSIIRNSQKWKQTKCPSTDG